jgi:modification methylase
MPAKLPLGHILQGDCTKLLPELPGDSVDLIFADPPYNLQLHNDLYRPNMTRVDAVDDEWDQFESFEQYDDFTRAWLTGCQHVLKENGTLWVIGTYHNIFRVGAILQDLGFWILNDVVFVKANPMPNFRGVRFTNAHETLIWAQKTEGAKYTFNHKSLKALNDDLQMRSDWYLPLCTGRERIRVHGQKAHPTQKPEALLYRVLLASSKPGDIVLDPFFGTGTTGAVAKRLHRDWIGIEKRKDYVTIARKRIADVQADMFEDDLYTFDPPRQARVPFGALLENGLLHPGQTLYFGVHGTIRATVLANGHIQANGFTGSIHAVGRQLQNAPCNGWEHWFYEDQDGDRHPLDELRGKLQTSVAPKS